jgi:hypothetical protein
MDEEETERQRREERARRAQDSEDFNNEIAGREAGRMKRFMPDHLAPSVRREREDKRDREFWTSIALQDQLRQFTVRLDELERASIEALNEAERRVEDAENHLERVRDNATRDDQGRLVYRTAAGDSGFYDDERRIAQPEFERIEWKDGKTTWEERQQAGKEYRDASTERDAIGEYRDRLHNARERVRSGATLDEDELAALKTVVEEMPDAVSRRLKPAPETEPPRPSVVQPEADAYQGLQPLKP